MDNRPVYFAAAEAFVALVDQVPDDAWEAPGLGVWDVRALVGHTSRSLTTVRDYLGQPADSVACARPADYYAAIRSYLSAQGQPDVAARGVAAGEALGADPPSAVREVLAQVRAALAQEGNPVITTIAGGMRLQDYLPTRVLELTVHCLDLTDALGLPYDFPAEAVELTVDLLGQVGIVTGRAPQVMRLLTGRGGSGFSLL